MPLRSQQVVPKPARPQQPLPRPLVLSRLRIHLRGKSVHVRMLLRVPAAHLRLLRLGRLLPYVLGPEILHLLSI